jgi:hypothetical protein
MSKLKVKHRGMDLFSTESGVESTEYITYTDNSSSEKIITRLFDGMIITILNASTSKGNEYSMVQINKNTAQLFPNEELARKYINYYLDN